MNLPCSFIKGCSEAKCQQRYYFPRMQNEHRWQIRFCKTFRDLHYYIYSEFIIIHNTHPCLCPEYLTWKYEMLMAFPLTPYTQRFAATKLPEAFYFQWELMSDSNGWQCNKVEQSIKCMQMTFEYSNFNADSDFHVIRSLILLDTKTGSMTNQCPQYRKRKIYFKTCGKLLEMHSLHSCWVPMVVKNVQHNICSIYQSQNLLKGYNRTKTFLKSDFLLLFTIGSEFSWV